MKTAYTTHLRILWGAKDANALLPVPPDAQLELFRARFSSSTDVMKTARSPCLLIQKSLVSISREYRNQNLGGRKNAIEYLEDDLLDYMQTYCARYGLRMWAPDLTESAYSIYNSACRLIAISTFKHALALDSYSFTGIDCTVAANTELLIRIYDHFIHYKQLRLRRQESRSPGRLLRAANLNTIYRRRNALRPILILAASP